MADMKTYRATEVGYDGERLIPVGELFTTDIPQGKWMELVEEKAEKPAPAKSTSK